MKKLSEMMYGRLDCVVCQGEGLVCEDHPEMPWDKWHQHNCGAGMPCECSPLHPDNDQELRDIEWQQSKGKR